MAPASRGRNTALTPPDAVVLASTGRLPWWVRALFFAGLLGAALWYSVTFVVVFSRPRNASLTAQPSIGYAVAFALCLAPVVVARLYASNRDEPSVVYAPGSGLLTIRTMSQREVTLNVASIVEVATPRLAKNGKYIDLVLRDGARIRLTPSAILDTTADRLAQRISSSFLLQPHPAADDALAPARDIAGVSITRGDTDRRGSYRDRVAELTFTATWRADPRRTYPIVALSTMFSVASVLFISHQAFPSPIFSGAMGVWCAGCAGYALLRLVQSDRHVQVKIDETLVEVLVAYGEGPSLPTSIPLTAVRSLKWTAAGRLELSYEEPNEIGAPAPSPCPC